MSDRKEPIVTVSQMRECDRRAIEEYGIPALILMEHAGQCVAEEALKLSNGSILVVAGCGNNGGDGFVAARHVHNKNRAVSVLVVGDLEKLNGAALVNFGIVKALHIPVYHISDISPQHCRELVGKADCIIDAIFGIGLSADITGIEYPLIENINRAGKIVIAVDVPSGLDADTGCVRGIAIRASCTVTMAAMKHGLVQESAKPYVGRIVVADIFIPPDVLHS